MTGSPTPSRYVGVIRSEQGWIGGTSPLDAHLVTPPPEYLADLLEDLVVCVNRADVDPLTQAAVAHAQFEVIHPFADGNGRVGRTLIAWVLVRRLSLATLPPVGTCIAADIGGYSSGLVRFRVGEHDRVGAVVRRRRLRRRRRPSAAGARCRGAEVAARVGGAAVRAEGRRAAAPQQRGRMARARVLPRQLALTAPVVAAELAIPLKSASAALHDLVGAGVLVEHGTVHPAGRGRPRRLYTSSELLGLAGSNPLR